MEHKFKPFQKVLVRNIEDGYWIATLYSNYSTGTVGNHRCVDGNCWIFCINYEGNEHFLGTTDTPKPKHKYKWGDKVEVRINGLWVKALYFKKIYNSHKHMVFGDDGAYGNLSRFSFDDKHIRPLIEYNSERAVVQDE